MLPAYFPTKADMVKAYWIYGGKQITHDSTKNELSQAKDIQINLKGIYRVVSTQPMQRSHVSSDQPNEGYQSWIKQRVILPLAKWQLIHFNNIYSTHLMIYITRKFCGKLSPIILLDFGSFPIPIRTYKLRYQPYINRFAEQCLSHIISLLLF